MRLLTIIFLTCGLFFTAPFAQAQRSLSEGGQMEIQSPKKPYSYARVSFSDGTKGERFTLKAGDCVRNNGDCRDDRERVEFFDKRQSIQPGDERWYAWSFYLPSDGFPRLRGNGPGYTFGQVHQRERSGPELLFQLFSDGFFINFSNPFQLDDDPMNPIGPYRQIRIARQGDLTNRWTRIMLQARWSRGEDGFINVWMDGRPVWSYRGATTNANDPLYFKYGLYRAFVSRCGGPCPDATVFYRNVRQGRTQAEVQ